MTRNDDVSPVDSQACSTLQGRQLRVGGGCLEVFAALLIRTGAPLSSPSMLPRTKTPPQ